MRRFMSQDQGQDDAHGKRRVCELAVACLPSDLYAAPGALSDFFICAHGALTIFQQSGVKPAFTSAGGTEAEKLGG
jgi:hypothetical protein